MPIVAVIIPCYNHGRFLPETIASVVGQTFRDWEIIIVDDGSTDNSAEVARTLIARFAPRRIRLIQQPNAGQGAARNHGIAATETPFILTLDADDLIHTRFLERTLEAIEAAPDIGFASTNVRFFGAEQASWSGGEPTTERMLTDCRMAAEVLFRRAAWHQAGGFVTGREAQGYEDWDFWLRLIEHGWRGVLVPEELCWYRRSAASELIRASPEDIRFRAQIVCDHKPLYPPAFQPWAEAVVHGWPRRSFAHWWLWFGWYAVLVARFAPHEVPKTLLRPAFKALGPHGQMYARAAARMLRLSRGH